MGNNWIRTGRDVVPLMQLEHVRMQLEAVEELFWKVAALQKLNCKLYLKRNRRRNKTTARDGSSHRFTWVIRNQTCPTLR